MTDTKFTPGPWAWDGDILTAGKSRRHLLYMEEAPGLRNEAAANMHLIAAAPELYEALCNLIGHARWVAGELDVHYAHLDEAVSALAKARGEA